MPAKSLRQQRYLYGKFGEAWVKRHHFDRLASALTRPGDERLMRAAARSTRRKR